MHRSAFHLESDVAGFSKRMLRDMGDERTIQVCPELAILRDDLHRVPLPRWFASPRTRGVIKRICRFVSAHGERHFEAGKVLAVEEPLETLIERHVSHLTQIVFEFFFAGRETILFQEVSNDVQIFLRTEAGDIIGRLGSSNFIVQIGDRIPALRASGNWARVFRFRCSSAWAAPLR